MTASDTARLLMNVHAEMSPLFDFAGGMKADLERRGWSPTAAEAVGVEWLRGAIAATWRTPT